MLYESKFGLVVWLIALLLLIGLIIYIIHCFPIHVFIFTCTIIAILFFNEIKYIS
jgi:hypothetical protein